MLMCRVFIFRPDAVNMNTLSVFTLLLHNLQAHLLQRQLSDAGVM